MSALKHPENGTLVQVTGDAERIFRARGWVNASAPEPSEKPSKPASRRRKSSDDSE